MKSILSAFGLLLCFVSSFATDYYVSSVSGNDSRTSAEATNPATPWKSINKVNSFFVNLRPGDRVLFKRGETFYGSLVATKSGTSAAPITIAAYGTGNKPILTGFTSLGGWVSKGGGIYECYSASFPAKLNMVAVKEISTPMGRWPNANAANKGYLTFESYTATSIIDKELTSVVNWTSGELVLRAHHWVLDKRKISSHSGTSLAYSEATTYTPKPGYGYFVQNHIKTLDQFGEWYYNASTKKLSMYFGATSPSNVSVKAALINDIIVVNNQSYLVFDNLHVRGSNEDLIYLYGSNYTRVQNSDFSLAGTNGIFAPKTTHLTIENCTVQNTNNNGIDLSGTGHYSTIRNNVIKNIGVFAGMGITGNHSNVGMRVNGDNVLIEYNKLDSIGYIGIRFTGNYVTVKNNVVDHFCFVKDDGGGIYTISDNAIEKFGRKIINNIVMNGVGAKEGTNTTTVQQASGIYLDNYSSGVTISGNTMVRCGKVGLLIRNSYKVTATNNTMFDNTCQNLLMYDDASRTETRLINFKHNVMVSKVPSQYVAQYYSKLTDMSRFGVLDSNYYARPLDDSMIIHSITGIYTSTAKRYLFNLAMWQSAQRQDIHSKKSPKRFPSTVNPNDVIRFEYNATNTSKTISLNATYVDVKNKSYSGSITLAPFSSVVLLKTGATSSTTNLLSIAMTSPTASSQFSAPASVRLTAAVTISGATISKVEFYRGSTLIVTEKIAPWDWTWTNVPAGTYSLTAKVYASNGSTAVSTPVQITVGSTSTQTSSEVVVTSPKVNASYNSPANVLISATASVAGKYVQKVDFYNGTKLLKSEYGAPYEFTWTSVPAGTYSVTAKAQLNDGSTRTSAAVSFKVLAASAATLDPLDSSPDREGTLQLRIFPNPVRNTLQIELPVAYSSKQAVIKIMDVAGGLVLSTQRNSSSSYQSLDVSMLKPGAYILTYQDKEHLSSKTFIKQ
jgi:parallel beta-helix repeat protein